MVNKQSENTGNSKNKIRMKRNRLQQEKKEKHSN